MSTDIPELLYRYGSFQRDKALERLEDILLNNRLWFSEPAKLNDPFELRPAATFDTDSPGFRDKYFTQMHDLMKNMGMHSYSKRERAIQEKYSELTGSGLTLREKYRRQLEVHGVCCFSENPSSLLMWAHYAEGHNGFRLTFATNRWDGFKNAAKVVYQDSYPVIDVWSLVYDSVRNGRHDPIANDLAGRVAVLRKSQEWEYEREWRLVSEKPGYIEISPECIVAVTFGCNTPNSVTKRIQQVISQRTVSARLVRMTRDEKAYRLVETNL